MSAVTAIRVPEELAARYDELARRTRRSKATYIREAMERSIDAMEWEYGIAQEWEDIKAGRVQTVTHDEIRRSLGLDD